MGCIVTGYKYVKKYCDMIKKHKDALIIVGNSVATSIPKILMNNTKADIGVMREGDITIVELLNSIENNISLNEVKGIFYKDNNKIIFTKERELIQNIDELSMIKYDLFDMNVYIEKCKYNVVEPYPIPFDEIRVLPINTARGCPYNCTFCYHVFKGKKYRYRSVENIGNEINFLKKKYDINYVLFFDELTLHSKKRANDVSEYFLDNNINIFWGADCRSDLLGKNDLDLALKLKESGCMFLGYSLESADDEILKAMNKHLTVDDFIIQTKILKKAGIVPSTSLVIGYPQETPKTLQKTYDCCYECEIYPSTGYLLPQPSTPMYEYALKNNKITDEEDYLLKIGDRQDFTVNLTNMKQKEIENIVKENLLKISKKLNLSLDEKNLIKTGHHIQKK